ncbi:MAG: hypothetical protein JST20_09200 [Bacteroidetes bacterium]|nr:hypothetical protein [Bacteroidota bacterium]
MKNLCIKYLLLLNLIVICACSNAKNDKPIKVESSKKDAPLQMLYDSNNRADRNTIVDTVIPAVDKKYLIKSGILSMKTEATGMKTPMNSTVYFDDYGNKECTEIINKVDVGNGVTNQSHHMSFNSDGYIYQINLITKIGTKTKYNPKVMTGGFSFAGLTENMKKQFDIKKIGTSVILGKNCDMYSMNSADMKGQFAVWKNLTLSLTTETGGLVTKVTTTKLQENVQIPQDKFKVPSDVKMTER